MSNEKYATIKMILEDKTLNLKVGCIVNIRDEYAIAKFSHSRTAKKIFKDQKDSGKDIIYQERIKGFVQKFKGKSKEEIVEILKNELNMSGGIKVGKTE